MPLEVRYRPGVTIDLGFGTLRSSLCACDPRLLISFPKHGFYRFYANARAGPMTQECKQATRPASSAARWLVFEKLIIELVLTIPVNLPAIKENLSPTCVLHAPPHVLIALKGDVETPIVLHL
jgi:hypothetical protein